MDRHQRKGNANFIVSRLLLGIVSEGVVEEALKDTDLTQEDIEEIKQEIEDIAQDHTSTAEYHKKMGNAINIKPGPKPKER